MSDEDGPRYESIRIEDYEHFPKFVVWVNPDGEIACVLPFEDYMGQSTCDKEFSSSMRIEDVADRFDVDPQTIRRWYREGDDRIRKVRDRWQYRWRELP